MTMLHTLVLSAGDSSTAHALTSLLQGLGTWQPLPSDLLTDFWG